MRNDSIRRGTTWRALPGEGSGIRIWKSDNFVIGKLNSDAGADALGFPVELKLDERSRGEGSRRVACSIVNHCCLLIAEFPSMVKGCTGF